MADVPDQDDDVDWKDVVHRLREGRAVEIPYAGERDYERRAKQMARRAERRGLTVDVLRGEGVLRVEPRSAARGNVEGQALGEEAEL